MIVPRSRRTFAQALKKAGLDAPTAPKDSREYRQQVGRLNLELLIRGIDHRTVGSPRWAVLVLALVDADLLDSTVSES